MTVTMQKEEVLLEILQLSRKGADLRKKSIKNITHHYFGARRITFPTGITL